MDRIDNWVIDTHHWIGCLWQKKTGRSVTILAQIMSSLMLFLSAASVYCFVIAGVPAPFFQIFSLLPFVTVLAAISSQFLLLTGGLKSLRGSNPGMGDVDIDARMFFGYSFLAATALLIAALASSSGIIFMGFSFSFFAAAVLFSIDILSYHDFDPPPKKKKVTEKIKELLKKFKPEPIRIPAPQPTP